MKGFWLSNFYFAYKICSEVSSTLAQCKNKLNKQTIKTTLNNVLIFDKDLLTETKVIDQKRQVFKISLPKSLRQAWRSKLVQCTLWFNVGYRAQPSDYAYKHYEDWITRIVVIY